MKYSTDELIDKTVKELLSKGCVIRNSTGNGHKKVVFPNGHVLAIPGTPKDARSGMNFRSTVRKIIATGGLNGHQ